MPTAPRTAKKEQGEDKKRLSLILAVHSPLRFFALIAVIMDSAIAAALPFVDRPERGHLIWGMLGIIVLLIFVVAFIEIKSKSNQGEDNSKDHDQLIPLVPAAATGRGRREGILSRQSPVATKTCYRDVSIQIFLPDWKQDPYDEFYQDGRVQYEAFQLARKDSSHVTEKLLLEYQPMTEGMSAEDLLRSMRKLYSDNQATYFLMTMSSKVHCIFEAFGRWHSECKRDGKRLPILISTVASAPGLADAQRGILRWYVRSQEESTVLAQYLRWEKKTRHVGVFFVTHRERQMNSHYGTCGKQIFRESFVHLEGETMDFPATANDADDVVKMWLRRTNKVPDRGVFVVGYGGMMKTTLDSLIGERFTGPIACSSTLTRKEWQPNEKLHDGNIVTVLPRLKGSQARLEGDDRDVVFFFAKETLRRVIEMTSQDPDAESFLVRWNNGDFTIHPHLPQLCEEHLSNGDSILSVEVVGSEIWRSV